MSDFLNNLAARSTGRAEQFRPRLPSLFEPASDRAGSSVAGYVLEEPAVDQLEDAEESATHEVRPSDRAARDRPAESATAPQGSAMTEPGPFQQSRIRATPAVHQSLKRDAPDEDARWQIGQQQRREDEIKVGTARRRDSADSSLAHAEERSETTTGARAETANARRGTSTQMPMLDRALDDQSAADRGMKTKAASGKVADQASFDERQSPYEALSRPRHSITEVETADNKPIKTGWAISTYEEESASSERRIEFPDPVRAQPASTIKVTIGRVEVRAIVNDSQARRPESVKARPRITLDEYLKQRNGGQR